MLGYVAEIDAEMLAKYRPARVRRAATRGAAARSTRWATRAATRSAPRASSTRGSRTCAASGAGRSAWSTRAAGTAPGPTPSGWSIRPGSSTPSPGAISACRSTSSSSRPSTRRCAPRGGRRRRGRRAHRAPPRALLEARLRPERPLRRRRAHARVREAFNRLYKPIPCAPCSTRR
jgi:hypothetical protein